MCGVRFDQCRRLNVSPTAFTFGRRDGVDIGVHCRPLVARVQTRRLPQRAMALGTCFIGCVGSDSYGETARKALADPGIDVSGLRTVPGPTGLAAVWIDGEGRNQIAVASGANAALKSDALMHAMPAGAFVVLQMETPAREIEAAIGLAKQKDRQDHSQSCACSPPA